MRTEELTRLADDGDATAAFALGFYWERSGNRSEAEKYYRIAAQSLPLATAALASVLALGEGTAQVGTDVDRQKLNSPLGLGRRLHQWFSRRSTSPLTGAIRAVGTVVSSGVRREEAVQLAELAANQGVATGHFVLGRLAMSTNSASAAIAHFQAAHELGSVLALSYIGQLKTDQHSPEFDLDAAERILTDVKDKNRITPHCLIAMIQLAKGRHKEAVSALQQGAAEGDAEAMADLALFHSIGVFGLKKDERLAAELLAKANAAFHI